MPVSEASSQTAPHGVSLVDLERIGALSFKGADAIASFKSLIQEAQSKIADLYRDGTGAPTLVLARAQFVDDVLTAVWRHALGPRHAAQLALVAVGGYGRGELHPSSDIDLLILLGRKEDKELAGRIRMFITFLWDIGLEVGSSVRTIAECKEAASHDVTIATNLMEARLLQGSRELYRKLKERTSRNTVWPSPEFFEAKCKEQRQRHLKYDDTAYKVEPNVKDGPGGLRDIQTIGWVAKRHFGVQRLRELVDHKFLTQREYQTLTHGQDFLWEVRLTLHLLAGRREDRLLFDYQRTIANQFGYKDDNANLAVEQFMKRYYRTIMELSRLNEMLLQLFDEAILLTDVDADVKQINPRFKSVNGYLEVAGAEVFIKQPSALLELFLILQQRPELSGVRATTIRLVRDHCYLIDDGFRANDECRTLFLEILRQPRGITHELHRMHRYGVLSAYLPVFGAVVGQMQYDLFHVYTVDEHTLKVVGKLRAFAVPEKRELLPQCAEIFDALPKPELLYIAGFFHDLAKGQGGDHSELGADLALEFCLDHGLSQYDARLVSWLVRNHLVLSVTSQREDITDPEVINAFAAKVSDQTHLNYLYLLTVGDIQGTNPALWNDWKASLLWDLYSSSRRALRRGLENPMDRAELIEETKKTAIELLKHGRVLVSEALEVWENLGEDYLLRSSADEIAWHTKAILRYDEQLPLVLMRPGRGGTEVFVYAPDVEFLFATTTATLGRLGLNILDARIITADNGMTLDTYVVLDIDDRPILDRNREREVMTVLRTELQRPGTNRQVESRLRPRAMKHFPIPTEVHFSDDKANGRTAIEVVTADKPGLLARIGWALADTKVRLQTAKIATMGERVEDIFFVTDAKNRPLTQARFEVIREAIIGNVDGNAKNKGDAP